MQHLKSAVVRAHDFSHGIKNEHVIMSGAYGLGAAMTHSTIGTAAIALGYFSVALISRKRSGE